jgi:hypothetical protein
MRMSFLLLLFLGSIAPAMAVTRYVATNGSTNNFPYTVGAAKYIQDAIDAADPGDTVLVSDGVYNSYTGRVSGVTGALLKSRVVIDKPITVQSVNGPSATSITGVGPSGNSAIRCVWMTHGASLVGFTLSNGATRFFLGGDFVEEDYSGGGVCALSTSATVTNCVIRNNLAQAHGAGAYKVTLNNCSLSSNVAQNNGGGAYQSVLNDSTLSSNRGNNGGGAWGSTLNNCSLSNNRSTPQSGGGANNCTLNNCLLSGNIAANAGGGAYNSSMNNCTLTANSASVGSGGGAFLGTLNNCIVYLNVNSSGGVDNAKNATLNNSCSPGLPASNGNITNNPVFVSASDFRLQSGSPCRDLGDNASVVVDPDLDGNARIVHGYVDMGAYEYQEGTSQGDYDEDGVGNGDESFAGTDFTNDSDLLEIIAFDLQSTNSVLFSTVNGRHYSIEFNDDLTADPQIWSLETSGILGTGNPVSIMIDVLEEVANRNYRVRVNP